MDKNKANTKEQKKNKGRPKIIIDVEILKNLASIGCPDYEIASVLGVSARTLKRNYADLIDQSKEKGRASLRKKMWENALKKGNPNMMVWLSKNELNMRDKVETQNITEPLPLIIEAEKVDG